MQWLWLILVVLAVQLNACNRDQTQMAEPGAATRPGAPLPFDLKTYASPAQVQQGVGPTGFRVLREDRRGPFAPNCPRLDTLAVSLGQREHLGHHGELIVEFVNDRLSVARFFPTDFPAYLASLQKSGTNLDAENHFVLSPEVNGWVATFDDGRQHVGWQDTRLYKEEFDWVLACS